MSMKFLYSLSFLIVVGNVEFALSRCCSKPFEFNGEKFCGDGKPTNGNYCGKEDCNFIGCNCKRGCRTVYPLVRDDIIGFMDRRGDESRIVCAATILNSTHLRFSGVINSKYRLQSYVNVPGSAEHRFNVTYVKTNSHGTYDDKEEALLQFEKLLPRSAEVVHHLDLELAGVWQDYFDSDLTIKLDPTNLQKIPNTYFELYPFNVLYSDE